jgi:hypothetical protein
MKSIWPFQLKGICKKKVCSHQDDVACKNTNIELKSKSGRSGLEADKGEPVPAEGRKTRGGFKGVGEGEKRVNAEM